MERKITTLTQEELVQRAFASQQAHLMQKSDDVENDDDDDSFAKEKARIEEEEDPTRRIRKEKEMKVSKGWGEWAGEGVKAPGAWNTKKLTALPKKLQPPLAKPTNKRPRADAKKPNVIISEKRISKLADKYMIKTVPYPYTTREEYERSLQGGVGREWNVTDSFKDLTRPEIYARAGKIIQPLSKKVKQVRAPAKF
jgi:U3 small nucleolar RNA-associated protein 14